MFNWMLWSWQSAVFFGIIFTAVIILGFMGVKNPDYGRKGFFPIETSRGDRLFIGVITDLSFLVLWVGFVGSKLLIIPLLIMVVWFSIQMKWG